MTAGGDYMAEVEANLVETCPVVDANQGYATAYASSHHGQPWSLSNNSVASVQNSHNVAYGSTENGYVSTFSYQSDQQRGTDVSSEAPKGLATPIYAPPASSAPPDVASQQEYSGYTPHQYSTSSHGYTSSEYAQNYYGYQQQPNASSHQQVGTTQNTGAPYQSLSSFQNASPYAGSATYSGTYYNPGDYQTTSGYQTTTTTYPSNGYSNQPTLWNGGTGGNVANASHYGYSNYPSSDANVSQPSSTTAGNPLQYQQQYGQWGGYYSHTTSSNVLCAPGTENMPVLGHNAADNQPPKNNGGYPYTGNQPPPPGTTSWRQDPTPSPLPASQGNIDYSGYNQGWRAGEHGYLTQHNNQPTLYTQKHLDSNHFSNSRSEDQKAALNSQNSNLQFPLTNQVSQNFQTPTQTATATNICQSSRIQIPTNPRIASNMVVGVQKPDKESTATGINQKPAYISVSTPQPNNKVPSQDSSDNKGTLPSSLRAYVERTFARCRNDSQRSANQAIMKKMITKASADGTLLTRNWDIEPLFPFADTSLGNSDNNVPSSAPFSQLPKHRKSPSRRAKSRWEPVPEEKMAERTQPASNVSLTKNVKWNQQNDNNKVANSPISNGKGNAWGNIMFVPAQQQSLTSSNMTRPLKRQRFGDQNRDEKGDDSSDSDKEHGLTKYYSSAMALVDSPEERKKREYRVKRFEKAKGHSGINLRQKNGTGTLYTRRTDMLQSKPFEDNGNMAVEDIVWDSLTVKGTCQEIEKRYLRLTSAPDPATVRPEDVLQKALLMVQSSLKNYMYKCDQLKSIRQDLTVQRIQNELTVQVYETHARLALEAGDMAEYNQCQSQLKGLYSEGIKGCHSEFSAYNMLRMIVHSSNNGELLSLMSRLSSNAKEDEAVKHALSVRSAVVSGNYVSFFRLYRGAPNLNTCLMDLYVEKMRLEAVRCMCKSHRPAVPIAYIAEVLGFRKALSEDGNGSFRLEDCDDWLRAHGAIITEDNNGELHLDTKSSSSTLYMPEPEDAVAHGDATLAVDDFLARTS